MTLTVTDERARTDIAPGELLPAEALRRFGGGMHQRAAVTECDHKAVALYGLPRVDRRYAELLTELPAHTQELMADGIAWEERIYARIEALYEADDLRLLIDHADYLGDPDGLEEAVRTATQDGFDVAVKIDEDADKIDLVAGGDVGDSMTLAALRGGADVIIGAVLPYSATYRLKPDLLVGGQPVDVKLGKALQTAQRSSEWAVSRLEDPRYDTSVLEEHAGSAKWPYAVQLAAYARRMAELGFAPAPVAGILGGEGTIVWYPLDEPVIPTPERGRRGRVTAYEAERIVDGYYQDGITEFVAWYNGERGEPASRPTMKSACAECPAFQNICYPQMADADDVSLVAGATPTQRPKLEAFDLDRRRDLADLDYQTAVAVAQELPVDAMIEEARSGLHPASDPVSVLWERDKPAKRDALTAVGVATVADVAALHDDTARLTGIGVKSLPKLVDQSRAQIVGRLFRQRGVDDLDLGLHHADPAKQSKFPLIAVHSDMENDGDHLIGIGATVRVYGTKLRRQIGYRWFNAFDHLDVADPAERSARIMAEYWNWQAGLFEHAIGRARACGRDRMFQVSFTKAENRVFTAQAAFAEEVDGLDAPSPEQVADELESRWVDLHELVTKQLVWPTEDHKLKTIAKYARFSWRDPEPSGGNCVVWYRRALEAHARGDEAEFAALRRRIREYNEDDTLAQVVVHEWLHDLTTRAPDKLRSIAELDADPRFARSR